ncbi:MAG: pseudouridine synthase [Candidatus Taylorbacteria bacterium]|nr:pseudouridine synthase [Candidatus Taylorbacteria bacterium]
MQKHPTSYSKADSTADKPEYPMRINKYLALKGLATRRSADDLIRKKAVTVNGHIAVLGEKIKAEDAVEVRGGAKPANYVYYSFNKPAGMPVSADKKSGKDIIQSIPLKGVFHVGTLEKSAAGLVILTNDRRIIDRLENPKYAHPKKYLVTTRQPLRANFKEKMDAGITIAGGPTVFPRVEIVDPVTFTVSLAGNAYSLGNILALFQNEIATVLRTDVLNIRLGKLAPNSHKPISGEELAIFLKSLGL